jgi:hypothetical protein
MIHNIFLYKTDMERGYMILIDVSDDMDKSSASLSKNLLEDKCY